MNQAFKRIPTAPEIVNGQAGIRGMRLTVIILLLLLIPACNSNSPPENTMEKNRVTHNTQANRQTIAELRTILKPYWIPEEMGGVALLADIMDEQKNDEKMSVFFKNFPEIDVNDKHQKWSLLAEQIAGLCDDFFHHASLKPGVYELENYHLSYAYQGILPLDAEDGKPIVLPKQATFQFTLTEEHLKLLGYLNIRGFHGYVELMDAKRPYGNYSYYYVDMANALGEPVPKDADGEPAFTSEQLSRYSELHRQMLFAVQTFWRYANYP